MYTHRINVELDQWMSRPADLTDRWDIGDTTGQIRNVSCVAMSDWEIKHYETSYRRDGVALFDVQPGQAVIALVALVEGGCTFGRTGVNDHVLGIWPASEFEAAREALKAAEEASSGYPWHGYFESLESLKLYTCIAQA